MAYDHIVIGSGINALVCAAMLGKRGRRVLVLEREDEIGGCMRTAEITVPGFRHDVMAATFVLFVTSPAFGALKDDLARHGLDFAATDAPTGVLMSDGRHAVLRTDRDANVAAFDALHAGDGAAHRQDVGSIERDAELIFAMLGSGLWTRATVRLLARQAWRRGARGLATDARPLARHRTGLAGDALQLGRAARAARALAAPCRPGAGRRLLGPDGQGHRLRAGGRRRARSEGRRGEGARGVPRADRGAGRHGAHGRGRGLRSSSRAAARSACGWRTARSCAANSEIMASVTPTQLYERLLKGADVPDEVREATATYRYGKGNMQVHYALSQVPWTGRTRRCGTCSCCT